MGYCLAIYDSGNYVYNICRRLEKMGYVFEVTGLPCKLAKEGCGYCLKFPEDSKELVIDISNKNKTPIREMYKIIPLINKNNYEKIL